MQNFPCKNTALFIFISIQIHFLYTCCISYAERPQIMKEDHEGVDQMPRLTLQRLNIYCHIITIQAFIEAREKRTLDMKQSSISSTKLSTIFSPYVKNNNRCLIFMNLTVLT